MTAKPDANYEANEEFIEEYSKRKTDEQLKNLEAKLKESEKQIYNLNLEKFAGLAMQGLLANSDANIEQLSPSGIARYSVQQAKALLKELEGEG